MNNIENTKFKKEVHAYNKQSHVLSLNKENPNNSQSKTQEQKMFDVCVFIGRFQPFHKGHEEVIKEGLKKANQCIVLVGSANEPRTTRNPFTVEERMAMVQGAFSSEDRKRIKVLPLEDSAYNLNDWIENVQKTVLNQFKNKKPTIALIGYSKDKSSYYLNLFPMWSSINVIRKNLLNATDIREEIFKTEDKKIINKYLAVEGNKVLPCSSLNIIKYFIETNHFKDLVRETDFVNKYKSAWDNAPYKPTFVTSDACVVQSGHVLLVKRNNYPGKGLWALPGGFVEQDETFEEAMFRELKEETKIKVPIPVLKGHLKHQEVFDAPFRSTRGRTITKVFLIHLEPSPLPKIKKSSESQKVEWVPLGKLDRKKMFEDHYNIIIHLTGRI